MQLEKNMYARSNKGIGKIISTNKLITLDTNEKNHYLCLKEKELIKASFDIIDLIEVGDYVNGNKVNDINNEEYLYHGEYDWEDRVGLHLECGNEEGNIIYENKDIKSVVTKEQFESMKYEVKNEC